MKAMSAGIAVLVAVGLIGVMFTWGGTRPGPAQETAKRPAVASRTVATAVAAPSNAVLMVPPAEAGQESPLSPGLPTTASSNPVQFERRIAALEAKVASLQEALDGVSIEKASAARQALFAAEEGYLKADEYFEAGKYAIAGEGYLTFLQNHPDHADAREVMKKARDAFLKAGYKDKAFWVQDEMMKKFPQYQEGDLWEQARLEKEAGLYDRAVTHAAQAAEMAPNVEERLWRRLYWAWYVQLRDGAPAGIAALQQVQQEIAASGVRNPKLTEHATKRMREWQLQAGRP